MKACSRLSGIGRSEAMRLSIGDLDDHGSQIVPAMRVVGRDSACRVPCVYL